MSDLTLRHKLAFSALFHGNHEQFALVPCTLNGEPSAAIVADFGDGNFCGLGLLFIAPTPSMQIVADKNERCIIVDLEGGQACGDAR